MTEEQSDVRVADFNDLLNDAIGANTSSERIAARKALVEAYRNAIAPSASIADTAGAKPVAEVVNKYGDPDAFAERDLIVNEEILKALPFGTQLFATPPAPSVADAAGASEDARDAARYRWLRGQEHSLETQQRDKGIVNGPSCYHDVEGIRELKWGDDLDASIDAAIAKESGND